MKIVKKVLVVVAAIIALLSLGGYFYFDRKFTPPENRLNVEGTAVQVPFRWIASETNPLAAILLPVKIKGMSQQFFMQLDCGSPFTVLYSVPIKSIRDKYPQHAPPSTDSTEISMTFSMDQLEVSSERFQLLRYGKTVQWDSASVNIIGTIGTDLFEKRVVELDFRKNTGSFLTTVAEQGFTDFEFEKRRILLPAEMNGEPLKFLFDSGTSAYELITSQEEWEKYRIKTGAVKKEKANSWGNTLTIFSAPAKATLTMGNGTVALSEVTYIEGTSAIQNLLMRFSGMQGMIGCKLFLNHTITLDCANNKFKIN